MTWKRMYNQKTISPSAGGGNIRLKHRELFLSNSLKSATENVVTDARFAVTRAVARLSINLEDDVKNALVKYFKTSANPGNAELARIKSTLVTTMNGISGDVSIKVSNINVARANKFAPDAGITKQNAKYVEGYVWNYASGKKGDIHVTPDYIRNNHFQAVRTFVHEATHHYASTDDFGEQGYIEADGSDFRQAGIQPNQCEVNADSYAYFVMAVGQV